MTVWFSSDWHIGHERIIELAGRPFTDTYQMNRVIIERCNDVVIETDTLFLVGDVVMGTYAANLQRLTRLRCKRVIWLPGNHDRFSLAYKGNGTRRDEARLALSKLGFFPQQDREPSQWETSLYGRPFLMSHYPYVGDSHDKERHANLRPVDEGLPLLHGHVHEKWRENGRMLNVGVDVWDFAPVSEHTVLRWLDSLGDAE